MTKILLLASVLLAGSLSAQQSTNTTPTVGASCQKYEMGVYVSWMSNTDQSRCAQIIRGIDGVSWYVSYYVHATSNTTMPTFTSRDAAIAWVEAQKF